MKVQYKNLKKKESVISLIKKHDSAICGSLVFAIVAIIISIGGYITSMIENVSFGMGILDFVVIIGALFIAAFFLYIIANYVWRAYTYVRMFFRYSYLPLTIEEAKALDIDSSPIFFFKTLKEMMTYYYFCDDIKKTIKDDKTEYALTHLFYQLFFHKDENQKPLILDLLNDRGARYELRETMKMVEKERYCADKEYALLSQLTGFFKMLNEIISYDCEVVDVVAFESDCLLYDKTLGTSIFKAIVQCKDKNDVDKNCFMLIERNNVYEITSKDVKNIETLLEKFKENKETKIKSLI